MFNRCSNRVHKFLRVLCQEFVPNFLNASKNAFSKEQAVIVGYAFQDLTKKISVETNLLAGNSNRARVEVTVDKINISDIDYATLLKEVNDKISHLNDRNEKLLEIANTYGKYIRRLEPKGKASLTVDCIYDQDKGVWEPVNSSAFERTLMEAIFSE